MDILSTEKTKILVVVNDESEEEQQEYRFIENTLKDDGTYDVFITSSAFTAIQQMRENYPLIIAQINVRGIGGLELLQTAKSFDEETQVLIITDQDHLPDAIETLRLGAYDYLLKPINDISELMNKVENAWATRNLTIMNKKLVEDLRVSNDKLTKTNHQLEKAKKEIEAWNQELEKRVRDRTIQLEKSRNRIQEYANELKRANEELRKLDKLKSDFMANVSHELRTPLTAIKGFTELLMMYPENEPDQVREFSQLIHNDTEKLSDLINKVLELSELETDKINWQADSVYLPDVVLSSVEAARLTAEERNITIETDIDESVPIITANGEKLHHAMNHLLDNAIKFNKSGGTVKIYLRQVAENGESWIRCDVVDTGIGVASENFETIFDRFHQGGDILTDKPQGMGLGLPITKEIVERHNGKIGVVSTPGKGSRFFYMLPVAHKELQRQEMTTG